MTYSDARYRAALRRARRYRRRYGNGVQWWQVVAAVAAVLVLVPAARKLEHVVTAPPATTVASAPSNAAVAAVAFARHQIGCPYVWAGTGPCGAGFDCSGLVMMAYQAAGVSIPRTSEAQWAALRHVTDPHKGDLVFFAGSDGTTTSPGHVGLVLGPHRMIQAYATGFNIMVSTFGLPTSLEGVTDPVGFARPVPLVRHPVTLTAASSYTPGSWAVALLKAGGWPASPCNRGAIVSWEAAEGGNWANAARYNPLNDKRREPGSTNATSQDVQAYTSWGQGFGATLASLRGPDYGTIRAALHAGNNAQAVASAVAGSVWGTQPFEATC